MSRFLTAQLDYTVPFTLVHAGTYRTEDKLKIQTIHKLNITQKKQKQGKTSKVSRQNRTRQQHSRTELPDSVASDNTWTGNEVGLLYNGWGEPT